jgi:hypothetical protein
VCDALSGGDGQALFLTTGESDAALTNLRLVTLRQTLNRPMDLSDLAGPHHLLEGRMRVRGGSERVARCGSVYQLWS